MTRARDLSNLIGSGNYTSTTFTATAGQTVFTIAHTQGFIQVFMNGLLLDETTDYTSNGTAVTLTQAATAGDELEVVKYNTFSVGDAITQTAADSRYVNASGDTMTGKLDVSLSSDGDILQLGGPSNSLLYQEYSGTNYLWNFGELLYGTYTNNDLRIGTNSLERMRIDSAGRVTMPYQPSFKVYDGSGTTWTRTIVKPNLVVYDNSNGYSTSTGRYTVPVSGVYMFRCDWRTSGTSGGGLDIVASDGQKVRHEEPSGSHNPYHQSIVALFKLSANDYVELSSFGATGVRWDTNPVDSWSGILIG